MKKLLLIALLTLGTVAFAAPVPVHFNIGCANFLGTRSGTPKKFLFGIVDRSACPGINVAMGGFQHGNPLTIPPNVSPVDDFNLPFFGLYGLDYAYDYLVPEKGACVFASYISNGYGGLYLLNSGACTRIADSAVPRPNKAKPNLDSKTIPSLTGIR